MNHSPTPWGAGTTASDGDWWIVCDANDLRVAKFTSRDNARHAMACVNQHDALVAALRELLDVAHHSMGVWGDDGDRESLRGWDKVKVIEIAKAALKLAEGKPC